MCTNFFDLKLTQHMMGSPSSNTRSKAQIEGLNSPSPSVERRSKNNEDSSTVKKNLVSVLNEELNVKEKRRKIDNDNNQPTETVLKGSTGFPYQHRCVTLAYRKMVKNLDINDAVLGIIKATPFSHLYEMPSCSISITDLNKLFSQVCVDNSFFIGSHRYFFTVEDVSTILCIPNSGVRILETTKRAPTSTIAKLFSREKPSRWSVENLIDRIKNNEMEVDNNTIAQLWLLTLFTTFLLPDSGAGVHISILSCISDITRISDFNWAEYIYRTIMNGIKSGRKYTTGCTWALMVWAYTKNPELQPPEPDELVPFKQWCKLSSDDDNIVTCSETATDIASPPVYKKVDNKIPSSPTTKMNRKLRLEQDIEDLKELMKKETEKMSLQINNLHVKLQNQDERINSFDVRIKELEEENKALKLKLKETTKDEPPSMIKRIKRRREEKLKGAVDEQTTELPTEKNIEILPKKKEVVKETKVYQTKRLKKRENVNTCTEIVLSPSNNTLLVNEPIAEPEEYVSRFLDSKKHLSNFTFSVNDRLCVYKDIEKLLRFKETSGALIDCYIEIIKAKYKLSNKSGIHFMDSVANQYISGEFGDPEIDNAKTLKRIDGLFRDVVDNIKDCRKILIPVNNNFHWHLVVIDVKNKIVLDYNSLIYKDDCECQRWFMWWYQFAEWKNFAMDVSTWDVDVVQSFPQQYEGSVDCGVFMLKAIEDLAFDCPINFTKADIPAIRRRMASDIIRMSTRTEAKRLKLKSKKL